MTNFVVNVIPLSYNNVSMSVYYIIFSLVNFVFVSVHSILVALMQQVVVPSHIVPFSIHVVIFTFDIILVFINYGIWGLRDWINWGRKWVLIFIIFSPIGSTRKYLLIINLTIFINRILSKIWYWGDMYRIWIVSILNFGRNQIWNILRCSVGNSNRILWLIGSIHRNSSPPNWSSCSTSIATIVRPGRFNNSLFWTFEIIFLNFRVSGDDLSISIDYNLFFEFDIIEKNSCWGFSAGLRAGSLGMVHYQ